VARVFAESVTGEEDHAVEESALDAAPGEGAPPGLINDPSASGVGLRGFYDLLYREKVFLVVMLISIIVTGAVFDQPQIAMWVGFLFAGYSAVANDSIQTIGTFISSNRDRPWWQLWAFTGLIFIGMMVWSYVAYNGDVSFGRLQSKGFETAPTSFEFLHIAAPLVLMVLTRLRMPVSTTFLLLSSFATEGKGIWAVTLKSVSGYGIAFGMAMLVWLTLGPLMKRRFVGEAHPAWRVGQWISSGSLWAVWLAQDAANIAVFLPRQLSLVQFGAFVGVILVGLAILFRGGGERIQEVVDEKSHVLDVRPATVIDFVYAAILLIFQVWSNVPMSTTWVFVGLLGGRELAMALRQSAEGSRSVGAALRMMGRDLAYVTIGFAVALLVAALSNPVVADALLKN
jgi:uncharacterized membrane protein YhdT